MNLLPFNMINLQVSPDPDPRSIGGAHYYPFEMHPDSCVLTHIVYVGFVFTTLVFLRARSSLMTRLLLPFRIVLAEKMADAHSTEFAHV